LNDIEITFKITFDMSYDPNTLCKNLLLSSNIITERIKEWIGVEKVIVSKVNIPK
jgi:hypothetical protein